MLAIAFAAYPVLSAKIFATFNCGDVKHANGNTRFLRDDYSINCDDAAHKAMESYAKANWERLIQALDLGLIPPNMWPQQDREEYEANKLRLWLEGHRLAEECGVVNECGTTV